MEPKFRIGQTVYKAGTTNKATTMLCPVCAGNQKVLLVLGNGDEVAIDCDYCSRESADMPLGYIRGPYEISPDVRELWIHGIKMTLRAVQYTEGTDNAYSTYDEDELFGTYEEALEACAKLVAFRQKKDEEELARKFKIDKSYSWNVGHAMQQLVNLERQKIYYEKKIEILGKHVRGKK